jgi:cardiolipin synthase
MKKKPEKQSPRQIFTIPNLLSAFRVLLALLYLALFLKYGLEEKRVVLTAILLVSAVTDFLDGKIARRFNMVSEIGKILDPFADKLTQGFLLICFLFQYKAAKYVFFLFLIKECYMSIAGLKIITTTGKNNGAMWYGKVSTAFFYFVVILMIVLPGIPNTLAEGLLIACGVLMLLSLILYARYYGELLRDYKKQELI